MATSHGVPLRLEPTIAIPIAKLGVEVPGVGETVVISGINEPVAIEIGVVAVRLGKQALVA